MLGRLVYTRRPLAVGEGGKKGWEPNTRIEESSRAACDTY